MWNILTLAPAPLSLLFSPPNESLSPNEFHWKDNSASPNNLAPSSSSDNWNEPDECVPLNLIRRRKMKFGKKIPKIRKKIIAKFDVGKKEEDQRNDQQSEDHGACVDGT